MIRSLYLKILLWFLVTLVVCLAGSAITNMIRNQFAPGRRDFLSRSISFQAEGARYAYETGGPAALREYFGRLSQWLPGKYELLDKSGRDVLTGADLSKKAIDLKPSRSGWLLRRRLSAAWPTSDGRYKLLLNTNPPGGPWSPVPYYLWIVVAATVFCYVLTVQLVSPLRAIEQTVERFGRGDLAVRASTKRRDEFGKVARAFNVMADRMETLLTAERRLLQDVSHELRSPLARLEFAVQLARTSPDREMALNRIQKEVGRLSTLVSELLQVTRAESNPEWTNMQAIALAALLQDVADDSLVECQAHGCSLRVSAPEPVVVEGDRELLRRAVENVLRNAIRYAPEGTAVEIRLEKMTGRALISIRDFGPGVPPESLTDLFKPFFRVEQDRNRNSGGGVGLGLSIAQRAVSVHKGAIQARNATPGLLVEIELPASAAQPESSDRPDNASVHT